MEDIQNTIDTVAEKPVTAKKKTTKPKVEVETSVEESNENTKKYEDKIASLEGQIALLMNMIQMQNANQKPAEVNPLTKVVTIIHLYDRYPGLTTHIQLTNRSFDMVSFGEKRTLDLREAEELVGKYRKLFERGILVFADGCEDVAERFNLNTIKAFSYADSQFVTRLVGLSVYELENLYNSVAQGTKQFILEYFKRKWIANDPNFRDIHKIELLNRLSDGAMKDIILDYTTKNIH